MKWKIYMLVAVVLVALAFQMPDAMATGESEEKYLVVFDFGNGTVLWYPVPEGMDGLNATLMAAKNLGLEVNYTNGQYGAFVNSINGLSATEDYSKFWNLLIWNGTSWVASDKGISSINITTHICWYYGSWGNVSSFNPLEHLPEEENGEQQNNGASVSSENGTGEEATKGRFIPMPAYLAVAAMVIALLWRPGRDD